MHPSPVYITQDTVSCVQYVSDDEFREQPVRWHGRVQLCDQAEMSPLTVIQDYKHLLRGKEAHRWDIGHSRHFVLSHQRSCQHSVCLGVANQTRFYQPSIIKYRDVCLNCNMRKKVNAYGMMHPEKWICNVHQRQRMKDGS